MYLRKAYGGGGGGGQIQKKWQTNFKDKQRLGPPRNIMLENLQK